MSYAYPYNIEKQKELIGREIVAFDVISSTNDYAKKNSRSLAEGTVVAAAGQTGGRGRFGRIWESERCEGIYMSIVLKPKPDYMVKNLHLYSFFSALAVKKLAKSKGIEASIKWPNDVLFKGKKICGILLETVTGGASDETTVIVGIGVNINETCFPGYLKDTASSFSLISGKNYDLAETASELMLCLNREYARLENGSGREITEEYRRCCINIGQDIELTENGAVIRGKATGISDNGALIYVTNEGKTGFALSGEVTVLYGKPLI